jgi:hypothetical protein
MFVLDHDLSFEFLLLLLGAEAPDVREEDAECSRGLDLVLFIDFLSSEVFLTFGGPLGVSVELAGSQNGLLPDAWSL